MNSIKRLIVSSKVFVLGLFAFLLLPAGTSNVYSTERVGDNVKDKQSYDYSVLVVRTSHTYKAKAVSLKDESIKHGIKVDSKPVAKLNDLEASANLFNQYDLILFDGASKRETKKQFEKFAPVVAQSSKKFIALKWHDSASLTKNVSLKNAKQIFQYYDNGGTKNFIRMSAYLKNRVLSSNGSIVESPIIYPEVGIYHPEYENLIFSSLEDYEKWNATRSLKQVNAKKEPYQVGVMLQRALVESSQSYVVDEAINLLEKKGATVIPFFFEVSPRSSPYKHMIQKNGETIVDVIINFRTIHWANKRKKEFEQLGVPIVQALTYFDGNREQWEQDSHGVAIGMTSFLIVLPESAGVIDPQIVAARNHQTERSEVIDYQLELFLEKAIKQAKLATNPNKDKKLTLMFWGDRDMGASFMNVPESLDAITHRLQKEGYNIEGKKAEYFIERVNRILDPFYRDFELDNLLNDDLGELFPVEDYKKWLESLPEDVVKPISEHWGQPEDNFMVVERAGKKFFVIPRIINGNMLILRQPPRGNSKDKEMGLYHNTKVPMNHYYLAAYLYARKHWNSDAFIHLGTHGTHEYLPGKDRGLSRYDGANLTTGSVPVVYPYIVDDVGEAMQAKRRGNAVIVSHMTPPFAAAGLQGVTADMHMLVDQYRHVDTGGVKEKTKQQIIEMCHKENLCKDLNYSQKEIDEDFDAFLAELHSYLEEVAAQNQPLGLHSFGELAEERLIISTLGQMLGNDFLKAAADFEEEHYGHDFHEGHGHENEAEHEHNSDEHKHNNHTHENADKHIEHQHDRDGEKISDGMMHFIAEDIEATAGYKTLRDYVVNDGDINRLNDEIKPFIVRAQKLYKDIVGIQELDNLIAGLSGRFIAPKNGGDPVRNPESLPTGFNLIGFDPARLPTKASWEQGKELVEDIIANYYKKHGEYPDKLAFSLWSVEAMRHYGVLESQALYAMGIRPVWSSDGRVIDTEIIPAAELKRPRVDVVLSATGLYRDAFPNVMEMLAKAIEKLSNLKEEGNSIWKNSQAVKGQLVAEGVEEAEAEYLSSVRIFSNTFGDYGSGVDEPIMQSGTWETDAKIADNYLATMGNYFGSDTKRWGQKMDGLYRKQLSGTDVALFARSSNLYGMITSDDPFEYFGSLALAVRNIDGKSPEMMISNLRKPKRAKMEMAASFLSKELRSRNFHKRWIQEMQKEGYSGAVTMAGNVANFWGWQVVDPNIVRDDQWQEFHEIYIQDKMDLKLNEWFEEVNPGAQAQLIERMLEAVRKDYWQASGETKQQLVERYLELVNKYDWLVENEKLKDFVNQSALGYGLNMTVPNQPAAASIQEQLDKQNENQVQGQKLEKVEQNSKDRDWNMVLIGSLLFCGLMILVGTIIQSRRTFRFSPV